MRLRGGGLLPGTAPAAVAVGIHHTGRGYSGGSKSGSHAVCGGEGGVSLIAASVAHPDMPFKRTVVCVLIAVPVLAVFFVIFFLMAFGEQVVEYEPTLGQ